MAEAKQPEVDNLHQFESNKSLIFTGVNSGSYIWKIDDKLRINNILNSCNGQLFESILFTMNKLKWQIRLYPNGNQQGNRGSVKVFLKLIELPTNFDRIMLSFSLLCDKGMSCHTDMRIYNKSGQGSGWLDNTLSLQEWRSMNINSVSLLITIKVHYIILKKEVFMNNDSILSRFVPQEINLDNNGKIPLKTRGIYHISKLMMNAFKWSHNGKRMESAIYDQMWRLQCYPNGNGKECEGFISLYLRCCFIPPLISKIKAKFRIICKETGKILNTSNEFSYQKKDLGSRKFVKLTDVSALESITFIVEIEIIDIVKAEQNNADLKKCTFYAPEQIQEILTLVSEDGPMEGNGNRNAAIIDGDHLKNFVPEYNQFNDSKDGPKQHQPQNHNGYSNYKAEESKYDPHSDNKLLKQQIMIQETKIESLNIEIQENKKLMNMMQNNISKLVGEVKDLRMMLDEKKEDIDTDNNGLYDIQKDIKEIKQHIGLNVNDKAHDIESEESLMEKWMRDTVGLPQYIEVFNENGLEDMNTVKLMGMKELEMIGIDKFGHRMRIINEVKVFFNKMQMNDPEYHEQPDMNIKSVSNGSSGKQTHQEGHTAFM